VDSPVPLPPDHSTVAVIVVPCVCGALLVAAFTCGAVRRRTRRRRAQQQGQMPTAQSPSLEAAEEGLDYGGMPSPRFPSSIKPAPKKKKKHTV